MSRFYLPPLLELRANTLKIHFAALGAMRAEVNLLGLLREQYRLNRWKRLFRVSITNVDVYCEKRVGYERDKVSLMVLTHRSLWYIDSSALQSPILDPTLEAEDSYRENGVWSHPLLAPIFVTAHLPETSTHSHRLPWQFSTTALHGDTRDRRCFAFQLDLVNSDESATNMHQSSVIVHEQHKGPSKQVKVSHLLELPGSNDIRAQSSAIAYMNIYSNRSAYTSERQRHRRPSES
ncbi:hypothetical protein EK21DRAFT_89677 [Setomelanomma holmii]|uniref:Uncharacterized protein n=1 Tax=Setomelanomma holmii TaxID=210430 RepID=A0A9P4HAI4_9PLEO|nr:hypothetical protein EK21DRAFT_89677 [Setomelanomma holmii]